MSKKKSKKVLMIDLQKLKEQLPKNPVAKFAHHVNKAGFFRDRTVYSRKDKHKDLESFLIGCLTIFNKKGFYILSNLLEFKLHIDYIISKKFLYKDVNYEIKLIYTLCFLGFEHSKA